jgi:hypothetical protein
MTPSNDTPAPHASPARQPPIDWDTDTDDPSYEPPLVTPAESHSHGDQANDHDNSHLSSTSKYFTCSQKTNTSYPVPVSVALVPSRLPISIAEKDSELCRMNLKMGLLDKRVAFLERELAQTRAELGASNAHCTLMARAVSEAMSSLEIQKCKTRRSVKTSACYVTHPSLHTQWEAEKQEKTIAQREKAEKEAQKATEDTAREVRICVEVATRVFSSVLLSSILIHFLTFFRTPGFVQAQG